MSEKHSIISIVIPTLNAATVLETCLISIRNQKYPQSKIEIIIADGGSVDQTLAIAQKYHCIVIPNPLKTSESGKAVGIKNSHGKYIALIDSDNILPSVNWLSKMLKPFSFSPEIIGSEPIKFTYRPSGGFIERYCALFGVNDPYAFFVGNYDRLNQINGKWTGLNVPTQNLPGYLLLTFNKGCSIPTIGANGTIFRSSFIKKHTTKDYLFDIDLIGQAVATSIIPLKFAKVKVGIIHTYCESSISKFISKQTRRIKDIFTFQSLRTYDWNKTVGTTNIGFGIYSILFIPPLIDSIRGYKIVPDPAWFFHPIACILTTFIYAFYTTAHLLGFNLKQSRQQWKQ